MPIGFTLPFQVSSGSIGYFEMTRDEFDAVNQDIHSLLITNWGERLMHFNFGCNLREFLFEQMRNDELRVRIADRIRDQMALWLPFVQLSELFVLFTEDRGDIPENGIGVEMKYTLTSKPDLAERASFIV